MSCSRYALIALFASLCPAQTPDPYQAMRAAMREAAEKQRAAVRLAGLPSLNAQRESVRNQAKAIRPDGRLLLFLSAPLAKTAGLVCAPVPEGTLGRVVDEVAAREGLSPGLMRAIVWKESRFHPCAVSAKGAQGLMQLMPETASQFGVRDPFDPRQNLTGGARFLKRLLERYEGDLSLALGAYNAGPGRVDEYGAVPPYRETIDYVSEILGTLGLN